MDKTEKIDAFAREARARLAHVDFHGQGRIHAELEKKYGITLKQILDHACRLSDLGRIRDADELANSVLILREPGLRLSFDRSLVPRSELTKSDVIDLTKDDRNEEVQQLRIVSPSLDLLLRLREEKVSLDDIQWRDFETLVADLLTEDGWTVTLHQGSKDHGVDIEAQRIVPGAGPILTIWQAKHLRNDKVGIDVVRELADTTKEFRASKGVVVTSSFLTSGALKRIERDTYVLGKVDRSDLLHWIHRGRPHS